MMMLTRTALLSKACIDCPPFQSDAVKSQRPESRRAARSRGSDARCRTAALFDAGNLAPFWGLGNNEGLRKALPRGLASNPERLSGLSDTMNSHRWDGTRPGNKDEPALSLKLSS
jgi:hypothetical protein